MKKIVLLLPYFLLTSLALSQQKIYVATTGNDANLGTKISPLATLTGARNAIQKLKENKKKQSIEVIIADGLYTLKQPLILSLEDSGTSNLAITYKAAKNAKPIFSGGIQVTNFIVQRNGIWKADISKLNKEKLNFPNNENLKNIRFKAYHKWDYTLRYINKFNKDKAYITTYGKGMKPWNPLKKGRRIVFENYKEALDSVGEWFLENNRTLYYKPYPNQKIKETTVIVPYLENLVTIKGDSLTEKAIRNIHFEGLTFKYCSYQIIKKGFEPNQAAIALTSAIFIENANHISFTNNEIANIGQHAIKLGKSCSKITIQKNYIHNIGGGGIYLGTTKKVSTPEESTHHIFVDNNILKTGGQEFPPAVGIWVGHSANNTITHNTISNFYYTGISIGWVWGYKPSLAKNNIVMYNHIHHIGWSILSDMAGIYTLGKSTGTVVNNNLVHNVHAYSYGGWGLYADEGSSNITFKNNLVYHTKTGGFQQHYGKENIVKNNIFAFSIKNQLQYARAEEHQSFTFTNNIILFEKGMVAKGAWNKGILTVNKNMYWNLQSSDYDFNGNSFKEWQKLGYDTESYIINPNFSNPLQYDFSFTDDSYKKINFIPFDSSKSGVYGEKYWIEKSKLASSIKDTFNKVVIANTKLNPKR